MSDIPHEIWFSDETPSGDLVGLEIDFESNDVVIEVEGERPPFGPPDTEEYRVSIPKLLNMIDLHSNNSLEFLKQQF